MVKKIISIVERVVKERERREFLVKMAFYLLVLVLISMFAVPIIVFEILGITDMRTAMIMTIVMVAILFFTLIFNEIANIYYYK